MKPERIEIIKLEGTGLLLAGLDPWTTFAFTTESPVPAFAEKLTDTEFPFPYDSTVFEAAERISNVRRSPVDPSVWITDLNLLLKSDRAYEIKVLTVGWRENLAKTADVQAFTGIRDSLDLRLFRYDSPRLYYQVQYRFGQGAWKALPPRNFKLPNGKLQNGGQIDVFFVADDHNFDDGAAVVSPKLAATKISGDYFYEFLDCLRSNPKWAPGFPLAKFPNSFSLTIGLYRILASEDPDLRINLGDSTGIGASYRWDQWGLSSGKLKKKDDDYIARVLRLRTRKAFSAVMPNMPIYWALGNHEGDESWTGARSKGKYFRQRLFPQPTQTTYPEGGHPDGNYYAFTWGADEKNRGGAQSIVLDLCGFDAREPRKIEEWTLGPEQLKWFEDVLKQSENEWNFACYHHPLGGWPAGSNELDTSYVYGRGLLFKREDYKPYADPDKVEQARLTELGRKHGLWAFFYGHDHIFYTRRIAPNASERDLDSVYAGPTKYFGELNWWSTSLWKKHYGDGFNVRPDFSGSSGITRLKLKSDQVRLDSLAIKRTPFSNTRQKDGLDEAICSILILTKSVSDLQIDKTAFSYEFVSNRPLKSSVRDWLASMELKWLTQHRVVERLEFKRLLLSRPVLVRKCFEELRAPP